MAGNQGKSSKKKGRNSLFCQTYKNTNKREKNKLKKLNGHLKRFPADAAAMAAVEVCKKIIRGY